MLRPLLLFLLFLLWMGQRGEPSHMAGRSASEQARLLSDDGHLVFTAGHNKDIRLRPSASGRVVVGDEDLGLLLAQIKTNKDDLDDIKAHGGAVPPEVTNTLHLLDTRVSVLENKVATLETSLQRVSCSSDPCQNGGTCLNMVDSYHCICPPYWTGVNCMTDVNECELHGGALQGCQNAATCVNTPGSFSCTCSPEWSGTLCTRRHDDCRDAALDVCVHGICIDADRVTEGQPNFRCVCESGWEAAGDGPACVSDVDECARSNKPCSTNPPVLCHNTPGSFSCGACPAGWQGDGYSCQDVDECSTNNGGCSTTPVVPCLNTMGSFHCGSCPPGYQGDGKTCTQVDICSSNNGGCHPLATCSSTPESSLPVCACPPGYHGNGYGTNGCTQTSDICQTNNPCAHGQCVDLSAAPGYFCNCNPGWEGPICDQNIDECLSAPCQNGGNCTDGVNGFTCICTSLWTGPLCQRPQQVCGGELTGPAGSFSHPNTPGHDEYDHQVSCAWVIRVDPHKIIRITFPHFDLESSVNCDYDFLQIHDGDSTSALMMGKFCGRSPPDQLLSSHNALFFWFRSDHVLSAGGFTVVWESQDPVCGGGLTAPYGSIKSPGYPGNYPPDRDCYWTVSVDPGLLITFSFGTLSLEDHPDCSFDFLEIRDGLSPADPVLRRYCSTASPPPLQTTGPAALVHFHSDHNVADRGFHITYATSPSDPGCGGTFSDGQGVITSPNWPNNYDHDRQCVYVISLPDGHKVALNFTHMNVEGSGACSYDFVEVRDGNVETDPLIGRFCGSHAPAPILSTSNRLWVRFRSDSSVTRSGFRALYTVACGGALSGTGTLRSPYHPSSYPHHKVCRWVIQQPRGQVVTLDFLSFDLEETSCQEDFVEVRDGSSPDSPVLGRFCGSDAPPRLQSTQRSMVVQFSTSSSVHNHGFEAEYGSSLEGCGDTLNSPTGTINSPGHPNNYPHGANCTWYISVAPGYLVRLTFESFNLELQDNCYSDYLEVYDNGTVHTGQLVGRYCGRSAPPSITSTSTLLTLLFVSGWSLNHEGFSAHYVSISAATDCGQTLTSPTGSFFSPNYPNNYPSSRDCVFRILVQDHMQIRLNFTDFRLEGSPPCSLDFVEIRDGGFETSPLIGRFCGDQKPPLMVSHSNRMWVRFRSDHVLSFRGFLAHWDGTLSGCGGTLTTASGGFSSPNYPLPYPPNAECYWTLRTSRGSRLALSFSDFHLESGSGCSLDYLAVHDGGGADAPQLARLCGSPVPGVIQSSGHQVYVKLRTDGSVHAGGFLASYATRCRNVLVQGHRGVLESLDFPGDYPPDSACSWTIQASAGNTVSYTFATFQLETSYGCSYDHVKLYDGPGEDSPLIGRFCGMAPPPANRSSTSSLTVVFRSDGSVSRSGFQMLWEQNGCGDDLTAPSGTFSSPGYPDKYPNNRECVWYIRTAPGSSVTLTVHEFQVEFHPDCSSDFLEVYGGPDLSAPRLARLCSATTEPMQVSSTGNLMTVRFKSDFSVSGRGFNASWTEVQGGCGGPITAPSGQIHSPLYPNKYPDNVDCSWIISVDQNHRVLLNFTDLDIETHSNCSWDYVAVYDGPSSSSPLLAHVCGVTAPLLVSTQNFMFVRFRSDSSRNHRGFSATFSETCGASITADDVGGAIASPRYPARYPPLQNCSWLIRAQEPWDHVTLSFTDLELEMVDANCSHDAVEVLDGDNPRAPLRGRYCGFEPPPPVTSRSDALLVRFRSDRSVSYRGFRATYAASTSACGGDLVTETGAFNSPDYPDAYPPHVECVWTVRSSPGNRLQLSFITFHLQGGAGCLDDYLEVREGNASGPVAGRFCGSALPANYTSVAGHVLWVKFASDASGSGAGFRATFSHVYGVDVAGESGQIASPLYPRTYPPNSRYRWTVTVDGDSLVQIRFLVMDIEDAQGCHFDRLEVFDGPGVFHYLLGTFCGLLLPAPIRSTGSSLTLRFGSDGLTGGRGFLLEWSAVRDSGPPPTVAPGACGGQLVAAAAPGLLFSPGWPQDYAPYLDCTWLIAAPGSAVELNFLSLDLESDAACSSDSVVVRDGPTSISPLLATACGRDLPGPLHSRGEFMFIRFSSDGGGGGRGFNASYSRGCGGALTVDRGVLSSPHHPQNYPPNLDCLWYVEVSPGYRVSVSFLSPFQIQGEGALCSSGDYLELRNGPDGSSPLLTPRVCGSSPPPHLLTSDNNLFVHLVTDDSQEAAGFKLLFEATSAACGGRVQLGHGDPPGYVMSPNYPEDYPPNLDCVWVVLVPNGEAVQVDFEDDFYIEPTTSCLYDHLELRDGSTTDALLISRLCGSSRPSTQRSTGSSMLLRFRTDNSVRHKGFKAKLSIASCGGTLVGQSGVVVSPGFPQAYPPGSECSWFLEAPAGHYLTLSFANFSLQSSQGCSADFVEIKEHQASGHPLALHCGPDLPPPVDTSDSFAYVRFVSDAHGNGAGFRLLFEASVEACGGQLTAPSGTISSPNYPNLYPHGRVCRWDLLVPQGRRVTLTIQDLHLEDSCGFDYVDVLNGLSGDAPLLGRLCGTVQPGSELQSSGNSMAVVFHTDASVSNTGFLASYSSEQPAVCGGLLDDPAGGTFTSPGYLLTNYSNDLNCEWLIQNLRHLNSSIVLEVADLHLQSHQTCELDFLQIRLGGSRGELLGRFCGQTRPRVPMVVFTPELWVNFRSDSSIGDVGFKVTYSFSGCGGFQTGEGGVISSPNYPAPYPSASRCAWLLQAPPGHTISLTFSHFHVEHHETCGWDSVTIFNGGSPGSPVIGHYCGSASPGTIQSGSDRLSVVFLSDHSVSTGGFLASWHADSSGCGGVIHADVGAFASPNHPQNFPADAECSWRVVAHEGSHVEMSFGEDFQVPDESGTCQTSFIKVWSGESRTPETLLSTGCGSQAPPPIVAPTNVVSSQFRGSAATGSGFSLSFRTRCGANFSAPQGRVVSPNYPADYPGHSNCSYTVDAGRQTVIVFTFLTFQVEPHPTCRHDGLKIYQLSTGGGAVATLCGSSVPGPLSTLGPTRLHFYSDAVASGGGFLAEYRAIPCGGVFNSSAGSVSSPALSIVDYLHNLNCSYHITAPPDRVLDLKFNTFHLEASSACRFDYVAVYDGGDASAPSLGRFCGSVLPPRLRSSTHQLFIVFRTDSSFSGLGWRATYSRTLGPAQGCGGHLSAASGALGSPDPDLDGRYEPRMTCVWRVEAAVNQVVNLTFSSFHLESSSDCRYDYVTVYDGDDAHSRPAGTFCGSSAPAPFVSSGNFLTVHFVTDGSVQKRGFNATYRAVPRLCGGSLNATATAQTAASPSFPGGYPPFTACRWILDAPRQETVRVTVRTFVLQPNQSCTTNYLEIKDWPVGDSGQSERFCGADGGPPQFYSYGRTVLVDFRSDAFMAGNGLSFTYQIANCSRTYQQEFGRLSSPGWPAAYLHNMDCVVLLEAPLNSSISFFFNSFNMESHPHCRYDYLEVFDGDSAEAPLIGRFCGRALPSPIFSRTNQLYLHLKSDFSLSMDGFDATWTSSPSACGGTLYGDRGSFSSPNYPGTYSNGTYCEWRVRAPRGRRPTLSFAHLVLGGACRDDFLQLYDGPDASWPPVGPFCGPDTEVAPFTASSHQVLVVFQGRSPTVPSGFKVTWSS